jgi:hypothetical protein
MKIHTNSPHTKLALAQAQRARVRLPPACLHAFFGNPSACTGAILCNVGKILLAQWHALGMRTRASCRCNMTVCAAPRDGVSVSRPAASTGVTAAAVVIVSIQRSAVGDHSQCGWKQGVARAFRSSGSRAEETLRDWASNLKGFFPYHEQSAQRISVSAGPVAALQGPHDGRQGDQERFMPTTR